MSDPLPAGILRVLSASEETAGTAFLTHDGFAVTCAHVVTLAGAGPGEPVEMVRLATGDRLRGTVRADAWSAADAADVAVVELDDPVASGCLPLGSSGWAEGGTFRTVGFPPVKATESMPGLCVVLPGRTTENGWPVLALRSQEITHGFSGAPIWDAALGVVVGMVISIAGQEEASLGKGVRIRFPRDPGGRLTSTAFMIPVETIRQLCPPLGLTEETPYRALDFFQTEHARFYFGREAETRKVVSRLAKRGVVVLVGTSGSGKSSLVRAGLAKTLDAGPVAGLTGERRILVPGADPLAELRRVLPGGPDPGSILIVDQFERVYTECADEERRDRFIDTLLAHARADVLLLIALRADFYDRALRHVGLSEVINDAQVTLLRMKDHELRQAIEEPARLLKRRFQPGLVQTLVADVRGEAGALPLLELTLADLWTCDAGQGVLTADSYEQLGYLNPEDGTRLRGVTGAIARTAEAVWAQLTAPERKLVPGLFVRLVAHEADGAGLAARSARLEELDNATRAVAERFVVARLLVTRTDTDGGAAAIEIAHEALLRAWPSLRRWMEQHEQFIRWYARDFAPYLNRWLDRDEHADFLLPESLLVAARGWVVSYPEGMDGPPRRYVERSADKLAREHARERERAERLAKALENEEEQRRIAQRGAEEARSLLWATQARQGADEALGLALAVKACGTEYAPALSQRTLADLAYRPGPRQHLRFGHAGHVWTVAQADDVAVSGADDAELIVWDVPSATARRTLRGHTGPVRTVALSAGADFAASGSEDRTVLLWEVGTGRVRGRLAEHTGIVHAVAITPDGGRIVSGSADNTVLVWDPHTAAVRRLTGHTDVVTGVAVSGDGATAVSCSADGSLRIWTIATGKSRHYSGAPASLRCVAVSADLGTAVTGTSDRAVLVWNLRTGEHWPLAGHTGTVWSVALDREARTAVSGSSDRTAIVWDLGRREQTRRIRTPRTVNGVALASTTVLCAGDAQRLTRWDLGTGAQLDDLTGHSGTITAAALDRDGRTSVSGSSTGELLIWQPESGAVLRRIETADGAVDRVVLSDDGRTALTLSAGRVICLWDTATGRARRLADDAPVTCADLSRDGRVCAATVGGRLRVWGPEPVSFPEAPAAIALNGDGTRILTGFADGKLSWRDTRHSKKRASQLPGRHPGGVHGVALSGDGEFAVSVGADGATLLWQLAEPAEPVHRLDEVTATAAALSADCRIVTLLADDGLHVWDLHLGTLTRLAPATVAALASAGTAALSSDGDNGLVLWDPLRGDLVASARPFGAAVTGLAVTRDGGTALCGARGAGQEVLDLTTGRPLTTWQDDRHLVNDLALSADGTRGVGAFDYLSLFVWDPRDGRMLRTLAGHTEAVTAVALSADGRLGVSGSADQKVIVWDVDGGEFLRRLDGHTAGVMGVALSADGRIAVSGGMDATTIVWDLRAGTPLHRYAAHQDRVTAVAASADGRWAAAASVDATISLCDVSSGTWHVLTGHDVRALSLAFTPCGEMLAAGTVKGSVVLWNLASRQPIRQMEAHGPAVTRLACATDDCGMLAVAGYDDGSILQWRVHPAAGLVPWVLANRQVREFTCAERTALLIQPPCDEFGNPPPRPEVPARPGPTSATLSPIPASDRPAPADLWLAPGDTRFDAVQHGRRREWRLYVPSGATVTAQMVAGGIALQPDLTLYGPDGRTVAVGTVSAKQRCRLGPATLDGPGPYTIVATGAGDTAGGYTISLGEV